MTLRFLLGLCGLACIASSVCADGLDLAQSPPASSTPVLRAGVAGGSGADRTVFSTLYDTRDWTGSLVAHRVDPLTLEPKAAPAWSTARLLDVAGFDFAKRLVLTHDGVAGTAFRWGSLDWAQQASIAGEEGETLGRLRVDHLRGDHRAESAHGGALRTRVARGGGAFVQGDIVNSRPWLVGTPRTSFAYDGLRTFRSGRGVADRPAMVYVGGNDGLLHGFDAADGAERIAYLPRGVSLHLRDFSRPGRGHRYQVDGSAFAGEARLDSGWATVLVGSLGAGGPGYFVLDVSRPGHFSEASAASTVLLDTTGSTDPDIGYLTSEPMPGPEGAGSQQIVRLNDGRWAVLLGNGVNSENRMPVLLIQYLDGRRELSKIAPSCSAPPVPCRYRGSGNGLSTPAPIDIDADGKADIAYAGDLLGNVWKFDLSAPDPARWKIAFDGAPLFTALDPGGKPQPIVAAPVWLPHPRGGVVLGIGTGRALTLADRSDDQVQTLYGLHDDARVERRFGSRPGGVVLTGGTPVNRPDDSRRPVNLVRQFQLPDAAKVEGRRYFRTAPDAVGAGPSPARGWFFDLPAKGEKVTQAPEPFSGRKVLFRSAAPGQDYLTVLDLVTGLPSTSPVFAALVAPQPPSPMLPETSAAARLSSRVAVAAGGVVTLARTDGIVLVSPATGETTVLKKAPTRGVRAAWRQVQ